MLLLLWGCYTISFSLTRFDGLNYFLTLKHLRYCCFIESSLYEFINFSVLTRMDRKILILYGAGEQSETRFSSHGWTA